MILVLSLCLLFVSIFGDNVTTPFQVDAAKNSRLEYIKKTIDGAVQDIQWSNDQNVLLLSDKGTVYLSTDDGRSWQAQTWKLRTDNSKADPNDVSSAVQISGIFPSKVDSSKVFLVGKNGVNFYTTDMGKTWTHSLLSLTDLRLHPTQASWVLGYGMSDGCQQGASATVGVKGNPACFKRLYYSKDFGHTWQHILDYVVQFDWSPPIGKPDSKGKYISDTWIYVTANSEKSGNQRSGTWDKNIHFLVSRDFFKTHEVLVKQGNRFLFGDQNYLFVAQVDLKREDEVVLKISRDNTTNMRFDDAILPVSLKQHSYTILDTSEGAVFLHVNHAPFADNAYAGHIYMSDWSGLYYTLSLPYNHRSPDGKCDFEKVEGLEGIYLANFIDEEDMDRWETEERARGNEVDKASRRHRLRQKTVITFDKGGEWHYLAAPKVDSLGKSINCDGCSLHLHGVTDGSGPFYTDKTATGIIMGTGNVGYYLSDKADETNTYLSRDAGLTWKEVAKGSHIYEFGDHGGLIVMAPDNKATKEIMYSWDEGITWTSYPISEESIQIENIVIEPKALSQTFLVYGDQGSNGVLIFIDFSSLHERACTGFANPDTSDSDYETWSPSDGRLVGKCLLGHTVSYTRRKPEKQCFNPEEYERQTFVTNCPCQASDFQCDYGYERKNTKVSVSGGTAFGEGECVPMQNPPPHSDPAKRPSEKCAIRKTKGYRRIPGDTCVGGAQWDAIELGCEEPGSSRFGTIILIILCMVVVSLAIGTLITKYDFLDICLKKINSFFSLSNSGYKPIIPGFKNEVDTPDPDDFFLDDDNVPTARLIDSENARRNTGTDIEKGKSKKSKESVAFQGLPSFTQSSKNVQAPSLAPPPQSV